MLTDRDRDWLRLHLTPGIGRTGLFHLQATFGSPERALTTPTSQWPERVGVRRSDSIKVVAADAPEYRRSLSLLEKLSTYIVTFWDDSYPEALRNIHDPPALLYLRGSLSAETAPKLAVVGSRNSSPHGLSLTRSLCNDIAASGISIVSGLARGIDAAAHEGALNGNGHTIAVLGCGIDLVYPRENRRLHQRICEQGTIITEYPPGTQPLPGHFPGRNRIISGLSDGVLIVEAAEGSGSLITADFALDQGRELFAIPGPLHASNSRGVNRLLKDGAHLVTEASDIIDIIGKGGKKRPATPPDQLLETLSEDEKNILEQFGCDPVQVDNLARKSGLTPTELSAILLQLELRGAVIQLPGMRYIAAFGASQ